MLISRITYQSENQNLILSILKRSIMTTVLWVLLFMFFMLFISPLTINKILINKILSEPKFKDINVAKIWLDGHELKYISLTWYEETFITIQATNSSIILLFQLFLLVSINFKNNKENWVDKYSESKIVWINKTEENNQIIKSMEYKKNTQPMIKWWD